MSEQRSEHVLYPPAQPYITHKQVDEIVNSPDLPEEVVNDIEISRSMGRTDITLPNLQIYPGRQTTIWLSQDRIHARESFPDTPI